MFASDRTNHRLVKRVPLAAIDSIVSARLGATRVPGNAQPAVFNRQVAMYLAKHVGGWSTPRIGKFYNGRDHSTVCHALKRIAVLRDTDPDVDGLVSALASEIGSIPVAEPKQPFRRSSVVESLSTSFEWPDELLNRLADRIAERLTESARVVE